MKRFLGRLFVSVLLLGMILAPLVAWRAQQDIRDWWKLRSYTPSAQITKLADSTTMNQLGRRLFYVHDPAVLDRATFNSACHSHGETSIVLGCYNGTGIYLFNVADPRLNGVLEVTSAHEMLHAAYDRLGASQKAELHSMLDQQLKMITNQRILDLVEQYRRNDPTTIYTEMHSIFGTELPKLLPDLEQYYAKYFSDRPQVAAFSEAYETVFSGLKQQLSGLDTQLQQQKQTIDELEASINSQQNTLSQRRATLEQLAASGDTSAYNAGVVTYNRLVAAFNRDIASVKTKITAYNTLVEERNKLSIVHNDLINTLDSTYSTTGTNSAL
jgi:hypothetical protein